MISTDDALYIGSVGKPHGLKGDVELHADSNIFDRGEADYLLLEMDGLLVPFFWEHLRAKGRQTVLLKFTGIDSEQQAARLKGAPAYYPTCLLDEPDECPTWDALVGFDVTDQDGRLLGKIDAVDTSSPNYLLVVAPCSGGEQLLLPLHEDLILAFDAAGRTLQMHVPEGLLQA